jgi:hypothetical protein
MKILNSDLTSAKTREVSPKHVDDQETSCQRNVPVVDQALSIALITYMDVPVGSSRVRVLYRFERYIRSFQRSPVSIF